MKAETAISLFEELIPKFTRREELERAFEVFKRNILAAEKKETAAFLEAAEFVSFTHYDFESKILAMSDLLEELEERKLL